ncbi:MAG TPA: ABC transporter permease [Puia sp.]|nr:ABC transporter permease [Puia sp.]
MFSSFFKTAIRNLFRNKIYSFINIAGLSLGLACAMLILLYVKDEVSYDRFHRGVENIYRIGMKRIKPDGSVQGQGGYTGVLQGPKFTAAVPEIRAFVRLSSDRMDMKTGTEIKSQEVLKVDSNFFSVFSFPLISGNPKTALKEPRSVVISEDMAKTQFGTLDAIGKTILFKNDSLFVPYLVTGVARKCPQNSSIKFDLLLPINISKDDEANKENWMNFYMNTFVVLMPQANSHSVEAKINTAYERDAAAVIKEAAEKYGDDAKTIYSLQAFTDVHLSKDYRADNGLADASNPMYAYLLTGIALFILLIACINFVNLTVARSVKRAKEIGIRKVVGGERKQLILQFLGESFVLCFIAFALAILIVQGLLPVFNTISNKALAISYLFDAKLVTGYILLFLITGLLAGFYPALVLSAYDPVKTLYSRFVLNGKNYLQQSLVVLQFALASFLIIATVTVSLQFRHLTTAKLGYDDKNLLLIEKQHLGRPEAKLMREELMKNPGIAEVSFKNGGNWGTVAKVNGEKQQPFAYETVDEDYLPMLQVPIVEGRNFSRALSSDSSHAVLVNEAFVREAGWKHPIGETVDFWYRNEKTTVIGVVKDYHYESLTHEIKPQLFTMKPDNPLGVILVKLKPGMETESLKYIGQVFKRLFPMSPYAYVFKDQENLKSYEEGARWKRIMLYSAILTIFISCIGLFGLSVLAVEKRVKEIGIRKVLGASVSGVVTILSKDFVKLVVIALLIAIPCGWIAANHWLQSFPYRISLSWWMFASAGIVVIFIALITVSFQSFRAALANPVKSLRTE